MKGAVKTLFLLSLLGTTSAHADIIMCKDASGRTLTSDRPIPECADRPIRQYSNNGILKKDIAAPLTAEQKREKQIQEDKAKAELAAAEEQRKSDRALLARYRSEDDIAYARKRDCDVVNEQIARQKTALVNAEQEAKAALAAVEAQKKKGVAPQGLQYRLDTSEQSVRQLQGELHESELELVQVNQKYDLTLQRYREISRVASSK